MITKEEILEAMKEVGKKAISWDRIPKNML
jgi:hypothetical protein